MSEQAERPVAAAMAMGGVLGEKTGVSCFWNPKHARWTTNTHTSIDSQRIQRGAPFRGRGCDCGEGPPRDGG